MRLSALFVLALGFGLASVQLAACSNSADDCNATATCGATTSGGSAGRAGSGNGNEAGDNGGTATGGGSKGTSGTSGTTGVGGEGGVPSGCSGDVSSDTACWTTNELGVFVSGDALDDQGDGTKEHPFSTITKAIASAAGKNVYVCAASHDYTEKVTLAKATDGIHLYGGFDCTDWSYNVTRSSIVKSPERIALRIQSLVKGAYIENISFTAADATGSLYEASSYGAFVTDSKNVVLKRVELTAGAGAKGADQGQAGKGDDAPKVGESQGGQPAICGGQPADADGGKWPAPVCDSRGGNGGLASLNNAGANGLSGIPTQNVTPADKVNLGGGATVLGDDGLDGGKGSNGNPGDVGAAAAATGTFAALGFSPAAGGDGKPGFPGQGGGGGGASKGSPTCRGASGGAGGMGGCGGNPGLGGGGGGASVGLLSWESSIAVIESKIRSVAGGVGGTGGIGGDGGAGMDGAPGGPGVSGQGVGAGGRGGKGGTGGNGGSGSGGSGGPSIALVYSGSKPNSDASTTLSHKNGGIGGQGGMVLSIAAPSGSDGASLDELEVK